MTETCPQLALLNVAYLRAPLTDPVIGEFVALLNPVNQHAGGSDGFVWPSTGCAWPVTTGSWAPCRCGSRWRPRRRLSLMSVARWTDTGTVHRVLVRNGLVNRQVQVHRRVYERWQREAPMQLWQTDLMGGVFLADGREYKPVTGTDDDSRFIVIASVLVQPTGRAVCQAFIEAMRRFGAPRRY
ncbi:DUF3291 domain-containing protein [Streptomyces spectabilis]|uniref:DUF3291 domain-containing protein n=2 Tax=Streptomyces spectabilis TaxID=68270 RepID=A0A5P2X2C3_STRST|nr:DUF3291 domain-containing protein [Streptomyces spectabilis]